MEALGHTASVRVCVDATPLLGPRTGVGRYVDGLVGALAGRPDLELTLTAFTLRGHRRLAELARPGVQVAGRPAPARLLQAAWQRWQAPPVELLSGSCQVFHATNFVLPPSRAPGVVTVHDLVFSAHGDTVLPPSRRYVDLVPRSVRRAALVLCPSETVADQVREAYALPHDRVLATPLGVSPQWSQAVPAEAGLLARLGLPESFLLFVGTREPRKDLPVLLTAVRQARSADPSVPALVLAGPAGWGPPLNLPAAEDVVLGGWLEDHDLRRVVAAATAVILPSRDEGFGLPLIEALATGTAVVASDLPVHREVTGRHAVFFPVGDVDALADALTRVAHADNAPPVRAARKRWAARYTWESCAELTAAAYHRAAA